MLDEVKFLRELPVLHGKIEMPDYKGVCTGVYLICEKGMGFISVFCTNERKENAIFGYDVLRNKGTFLSLHQIEILNCKIGKEQDSELHFNKGVAFDDIHDVVERNSDNLKDKGIIAIKGTKIFYDVYADMVSIPELQTYVNGIRQDIVAVKNGIAMQYNNGLAEGSVNKLKVIKRIMYGRNSFELLKAKVLLPEQFRCKIN